MLCVARAKMITQTINKVGQQRKLHLMYISVMNTKCSSDVLGAKFQLTDGVHETSNVGSPSTVSKSLSFHFKLSLTCVSRVCRNSRDEASNSKKSSPPSASFAHSFCLAHYEQRPVLIRLELPPNFMQH